MKIKIYTTEVLSFYRVIFIFITRLAAADTDRELQLSK